MDELIFEDPPEAALLRRQPGHYVEFAIALREHEGRWAVLPGGDRSDKAAQSAAQNIRRGITKGFTKGEYESAADAGKVYVRFTGRREPADDSEGDPARREHIERSTPGPARDPAAAPLVRAWARTQGLNVPARGRIPDEIWAAYARSSAGLRVV